MFHGQRSSPHSLPPTDFYIRFHFIQFLKLYHNPQRDHQALFLCRQHMESLLVLAASTAPHIRHRFQQLSGAEWEWQLSAMLLLAVPRRVASAC